MSTPHSPRGRVAFFYPGDLTGADLNHIAGSGRLVDLAKIAAHGGADVLVIGLVDGPARELVLPSGLNCQLFSTDQPTVRHRPSFVTSGPALMKQLGPYLLEQGVGTVCMYGTSLRYAKALHDFCRPHGISLAASVNEWGHRSAQSLPSFLLLRAGIYYVARRYDKVIAISDLMMSFFSRFSHLSVLQIPSVFDVTELPAVDPGVWERAELKDKVVLAYAGSVKQGKDAINNVIRALALLSDADRARFVFWLAGSDRNSILASLGNDAAQVLARTESILDFKGFLPRARVQELVAQADYTVLLRPDAAYANAGFPTKFGESMVLGVPVIANLTSDLGTYLHDGVEGYVVPDDSPAQTASTLKRILDAHTPPNRQMRARALATGRRSFDLRVHAGPMAEFLGLTGTMSQ